MHIGGIAFQHIDDLERPVFCPSMRNSLTELTSAIGWRVGELADEPQRLSNSRDRHDLRSVHQRLGELADRDLALGHDHDAAQPGSPGVRRG